MTEGELETLRLKMRIEVLQQLLRGLYTGMANSSPSVARIVREQFSALRQEHAKIVIPGVRPEYSDLIAGEYQEALEDALSHIESGIRKD
jgi:hypothetical protein